MVACASLLGILLLAFPAFASYGYAQHGMNGFFAAVMAATICTVAGAMALLTTGYTAAGAPKLAVSGALVGMLFRLLIPLAMIVLLKRQGGPLVEAQVVGMLLLYYLLMLAVETGLSVWLLKPFRLYAPRPLQTEDKAA